FELSLVRLGSGSNHFVAPFGKQRTQRVANAAGAARNQCVFNHGRMKGLPKGFSYLYCFTALSAGIIAVLTPYFDACDEDRSLKRGSARADGCERHRGLERTGLAGSGESTPEQCFSRLVCYPARNLPHGAIN